MPTIMTHAIVPLALAAALGPSRISRKVAVMGAVLTILPDADVIGFAFGIQYGEEWGHRGATHSIMIAMLVAGAVSIVWSEVRTTFAFLFLALCMVSHGLLDTVTNGGLGIALLWPYENARYFAPHTPVLVSPIGANFFSARGLATLISEVQWIWLPAALIGALGWSIRRIIPGSHEDEGPDLKR